MEDTLQISILIFVFISTLVCIFNRNSIKNSKKKHLVAAMFFVGAALIHAFVIVFSLYFKLK